MFSVGRSIEYPCTGISVLSMSTSHYVLPGVSGLSLVGLKCMSGAEFEVSPMDLCQILWLYNIPDAQYFQFTIWANKPLGSASSSLPVSGTMKEQRKNGKLRSQGIRRNVERSGIVSRLVLLTLGDTHRSPR
jgi:hypothetical protein